ncbi:MAG: ArnT family glycosyltransferase [Crocinitomicaceae bacterium]
MMSLLRKLPIRFQALLLLFVLFSLYGVFDHFFQGIFPIHEWRKTDSLSIALNYYKGTPFLEPQTQWIAANGTRNAAAEFPVIYFILGKLWYFFGVHEWISKCLSISILFISISLFSEVVEQLFQQKRKALLFVLMIASSPVLVFYSDSILPNLYAFSFVLLGAYGTYKFLHSKHVFWLGFLTAFFALSVLIKITALICLLSFGGAYFLFALFHVRQSFKTHAYFWFAFLISFGLILLVSYLWYAYAIRYNERVGSDLFSTTVRPIWEVDANARKEIWQKFWKYMLPGLYHPSLLLISVLFFLYSAWKKWISPFIFWLVFTAFLGLGAYFILWFWVFDVHDYYLIEMLFFPLILFYVLIEFGDRLFSSLRKTRLLFACWITLTVVQAISLNHWSFGKENVLTKNTPFVSDFVKGNWGYFHFYHNTHLKQLQDFSVEIQRLIPKTDTILCLTDPSPNIYLYTLNRVGYTHYSFREPSDNETNQIAEFIQKGSNFAVVISEPESEPRKDWEMFLKYEIFKKQNIRIFDLRPFRMKKS